MMQTFVQRLGPTALYLPDLTNKGLPEDLAMAHLGLLKETSFIIHDLSWQAARGFGVPEMATMYGMRITTSQKPTSGPE